MKNPEYERSSTEGSTETENDEFGYSEKQTDLQMEIQAGEWQNLRKFKTYRNRSRQGKIIASYQAVSNRLNQLVGMYYKLVRDNPTKGAKMLEEIKRLRLVQEVLLQCLSWEPAGKLDKNMIPSDVWEMIR